MTEETGAFLISRRDAVSEETRIGAHVAVYEVPYLESIDIDDRNDWILTESLFKRKKICVYCKESWNPLSCSFRSLFCGTKRKNLYGN